ncbi:MAG: hypothetical protein NT154_22875, partial [Verrucomicrobia bacterium]|nr:hypothetical protein [Verrucomicrobiota bacterium]
NGAELLFHSRMTPIIVNQCEDVEIRNLSIDHTRPTVSEFTLQSIGDTSMDVKVHPDSADVIEDGNFQWVGADGDRWVPQLFQPYDPERDITCGWG